MEIFPRIIRERARTTPSQKQEYAYRIAATVAALLLLLTWFSA